MRFLFLGDIVGKSGRCVVAEFLPSIIKKYSIDFVVANGENAAGGYGITEKIYHELREYGCNVITSGNHAFDQREALQFSAKVNHFLRPYNYPKGTPGKGANIFFAKNGTRILLANIMGRVFMHPELDDPFQAAEQILKDCPFRKEADVVIFDFHAEATSEKQCFAHFLDGRVSAVIGTHTHVPTADAQILSQGTAYISDVGMCGDYDSSLGMDKEEPLQRFLTKLSKSRYEAASGPGTLCGLCIDICTNTGLANKVAPLRLGPRLQEALPDFW